MWIKTPPLSLETGGKIKFDTELNTRVAIEVLVPEKPTWDFGGWLYPVVNNSIGEVEGAWRRIYLKKRQVIIIDNAEITGNFLIVFEPVNWLKQFEVTLFRWQPVDTIKSSEIEIVSSSDKLQVLVANASRKDYSLTNFGPGPLIYSWGATSLAVMARLNPGEMIEESATNNKQPLFVSTESEPTTIFVIERSEL